MLALVLPDNTIVIVIFDHVAERHGLKEPRRMEELQTKVIDSLKEHCTYNAEAQKINQYFSRVLGKIPELRNLSREGLQRLVMLKQECPNTPELIDKLCAVSKQPC